MTGITKAENMVAGWLKPVPHLPKPGQKWLAENVWWIVLIGVIAAVIGILIGIGGIFTYMAFVGNAPSYYGYYTVSTYGSGWIFATVVSLLFSVLVAALLATAINPLKAMQRKGWDRLFLVLLINAVSVVVTAILSFSVFGFIFGIIFGAIGLAISSYLIFEIRSHFVGAHAKHVKK